MTFDYLIDTFILMFFSIIALVIQPRLTPTVLSIFRVVLLPGEASHKEIS